MNKIVSYDLYKKIEDLKYIVLPGRFVTHDAIKYYNSAYKLWKDVWKTTLMEVDGISRIYSDDFTRQDEVAGLFDGDNCLMLSFFRMVDLSFESSNDDSYFKVWGEENLNQLKVINNLVLVGSNITISPLFRGKYFGFSSKDFIMGLLIKRFISTPAFVMAGTMRNDRNMHECAYKFGATALKKDVIHHGISSDLVAFQKSQMVPCSEPNINEAVEFIWSRRTIYSHNYGADFDWQQIKRRA